MTARSSRKTVPLEHAQRRLAIARDYKKLASAALDLTEEGANAGPVVSLTVSAAIAYADAVTAHHARVINRGDHATVTRLLRDVMRQALPVEHERLLAQFLGRKDEAQYGTQVTRREEAAKLLVKLDRFAQWAEDRLVG